MQKIKIAFALNILLCLGATVVNGATDAPNTIATVVGTKAMRPTPAIIMAVVESRLGGATVEVVLPAV